jgi:hypothetical protein
VDLVEPHGALAGVDPVEQLRRTTPAALSDSLKFLLVLVEPAAMGGELAIQDFRG